jgi:membrane protein required for colicin V production
MNTFDMLVYLGLVVAIVTGFRAGFLRSAATMLAYLTAAPIAVWAISLIAPQMEASLDAPLTKNAGLFFGIYLLTGIVLGKCFRMLLDESTGPTAGPGDRILGALLGICRVGFVAVTLVLIFDQIIPDGREPEFLTGSKLRPLLSSVGRRGFQALPPDVTATIERLKRNQHL